jgi:hypothetical protein
MARKATKIKDPRNYAWAVEKGFGTIPSRPLFARSFADYKDTFKAKIKKAKSDILSAWR